MKNLTVNNNTSNKELDSANIIILSISFDNAQNNLRIKNAYERISKNKKFKIEEISSGQFGMTLQATKL